MGTRGTMGYVLEGVEKLTYNHFDSYPGGLGLDTLAFFRGANLDQIREQVAALKMVTEQTPPTPEQIEQLKGKYSDENVYGNGEGLVDWYVLLRNCQGDHKLTLQSGYMLEDLKFPIDSLFCEWGYIADLDHEMLEVYKGFQSSPHSEGRFADRYEGGDYYPIKMVAAYPLRELPDDETFCRQLEPDEED